MDEKNNAQTGAEEPRPHSEPIEGLAPFAMIGGGLADVSGATINEIRKIVGEADGIKVREIIVEGSAIPLVFRRDANGNQTQVDVLAEVDKWRTRPQARKGTAVVTTRDSFSDLVNRHKDDGSALFAMVAKDSASVLAVIDYHELDLSPRFGRHRIRYNFPFSEDWKRWTGIDDETMSQGEFAEFVEERFVDLVAPTEDERKFFEPIVQVAFGTPAEILTLAKGLEVHETSRVVNSTTLANGTGQIVFESEQRDASGNTLRVPGLFMLSIPMFDGGVRVRVPVRLRYTARGSLSWRFLLFRVEEFVRITVDMELAAIKEATGLPLFYGQPEGSEVVSFVK